MLGIVFTRLLPFSAPGLDEIALLGELQNPRVRPPVALDDEHGASWSKRQIVRLVQQSSACRFVPVAGLSFDTPHLQYLSLRAQLRDGVPGNIGRPDIAVSVDPHAMGTNIQTFTHRADELAVLVEFHQRMIATIEDHEVTVRCDRYRGWCAQHHAVRET